MPAAMKAFTTSAVVGAALLEIGSSVDTEGHSHDKNNLQAMSVGADGTVEAVGKASSGAARSWKNKRNRGGGRKKKQVMKSLQENPETDSDQGMTPTAEQEAAFLPMDQDGDRMVSIKQHQAWDKDELVDSTKSALAETKQDKLVDSANSALAETKQDKLVDSTKSALAETKQASNNLVSDGKGSSGEGSSSEEDKVCCSWADGNYNLYPLDQDGTKVCSRTGGQKECYLGNDKKQLLQTECADANDPICEGLPAFHPDDPVYYSIEPQSCCRWEKYDGFECVLQPRDSTNVALEACEIPEGQWNCASAFGLKCSDLVAKGERKSKVFEVKGGEHQVYIHDEWSGTIVKYELRNTTTRDAGEEWNPAVEESVRAAREKMRADTLAAHNEKQEKIEADRKAADEARMEASKNQPKECCQWKNNGERGPERLGLHEYGNYKTCKHEGTNCSDSKMTFGGNYKDVAYVAEEVGCENDAPTCEDADEVEKQSITAETKNTRTRFKNRKTVEKKVETWHAKEVFAR